MIETSPQPRRPPSAEGIADDSKQELVETLRAMVGQWVAVKDDELLVAASTSREVVDWLARHDRHADSMFRVPEDRLASSGLAPL